MRIISAAMRSAMVVTASVAFCLSAHAADTYQGVRVFENQSYFGGRAGGSCPKEGPPLKLIVDGSQVSFITKDDTMTGKLSEDGSFVIEGHTAIATKSSGFVQIKHELKGLINDGTAKGTYTTSSSLVCVYSFTAERQP